MLNYWFKILYCLSHITAPTSFSVGERYIVHSIIFISKIIIMIIITYCVLILNVAWIFMIVSKYFIAASSLLFLRVAR